MKARAASDFRLNVINLDLALLSSALEPRGWTLLMLYITRRDTFAASHRLHNSELSAEENARLYGKCNWENGHGHNYVLEVTVVGEVSPRTGMVCNLKTLKQVMRERVIDHVDHRHLNYDVEFLRGINPTSENVAVAIWERLDPHIPDGRLYRVRLFETENNVVDYYGPTNRSSSCV